MEPYCFLCSKIWKCNGVNGTVIPFFLKKKIDGVLPITITITTRFNISLKGGVQMVMHAIDNAWGDEIFIPKIPSYRITDVANKLVHTPKFMLLVGNLMGYKKTQLFGLEHNYVRDILNKNPLCGTHFYNHTYEDVLLSKGHTRDREKTKRVLSKLLGGNASIFEGYDRLAEWVKERNVEVIDHSNGSLFMFQDYSLWDLVEPKKINL